jgi:hypothetical protein
MVDSDIRMFRESITTIKPHHLSRQCHPPRIKGVLSKHDFDSSYAFTVVVLTSAVVNPPVSPRQVGFIAGAITHTVI